MTSHTPAGLLPGATPIPAPPDLPRVREHRGVLFLALRLNDRLAVATTIERLVNMLDAADADPDLEPGLGGYSGPGDDREGADDERLFGSGFGTAGCEDDEDADPAGGDIVDEPHDEGGFGENPDFEPSLGWPEQVDQERRTVTTDEWLCEDGEEDGGDMPEGGDEREPDDADLTGFGWLDDDPTVSQDDHAFHAAVRPLAEQAARP